MGCVCVSEREREREKEREREREGEFEWGNGLSVEGWVFGMCIMHPHCAYASCHWSEPAA